MCLLFLSQDTCRDVGVDATFPSLLLSKCRPCRCCVIRDGCSCLDLRSSLLQYFFKLLDYRLVFSDKLCLLVL